MEPPATTIHQEQNRLRRAIAASGHHHVITMTNVIPLRVKLHLGPPLPVINQRRQNRKVTDFRACLMR
jgi:hypothetical protein